MPTRDRSKVAVLLIRDVQAMLPIGAWVRARYLHEPDRVTLRQVVRQGLRVMKTQVFVAGSPVGEATQLNWKGVKAEWIGSDTFRLKRRLGDGAEYESFVEFTLVPDLAVAPEGDTEEPAEKKISQAEAMRRLPVGAMFTAKLIGRYNTRVSPWEGWKGKKPDDQLTQRRKVVQQKRNDMATQCYVDGRLHGELIYVSWRGTEVREINEKTLVFYKKVPGGELEPYLRVEID